MSLSTMTQANVSPMSYRTNPPIDTFFPGESETNVSKDLEALKTDINELTSESTHMAFGSLKRFFRNTFESISEAYGKLSLAQKALLITTLTAGSLGLGYYLLGPASVSTEAEKLSDVLDGKQFLVIHDNKPKGDSAAGTLLARVGLIDEKKGYTKVSVEGTPLESAKDLESLIKRGNNDYITCQSNGKCFKFAIEHDLNDKPVAKVFDTFKLHSPKGEYTNIEAVAISPDDQIFWSHRGDPNKFSTIPFDEQKHLNHVFSAKFYNNVTEYEPETTTTHLYPFGQHRVEFRPRSDHIITDPNQHLFVAAADPEETGTTDFDMHSIVYTDSGKVFYRLEGDKIEAITHDPKTDTFYLGSDNEGAGARVCKLSLRALAHKCITILTGQEYGVSGMVAT